MRECPSGCGYKRCGYEIDRSSLDFACPRCGQHSIKSFVEPPPEVVEPTQDYKSDDGYGWIGCYLSYGGSA